MYEPLPSEAAFPIASIALLAVAWGLWRGRKASRWAMVGLLAAALIAAALTRFAPPYSLLDEGSLIVGGSALVGILALIGPALVEGRLLAGTISALLIGLFLFAGLGVFMVGLCVAFGACV